MNTTDGPTLSIQEQADEVRDELWTFRQSQPVGQDTPAHVPPARWYLPALKEAVGRWQEALRLAREEIPADLAYTADQLTRRFRDGWPTTADHSPEIRRLLTVASVLALMEAAVEDLENEGKPVTVNLKLTKHRQR